jgi:plasmid maintenance system antidote protein VapI
LAACLGMVKQRDRGTLGLSHEGRFAVRTAMAKLRVSQWKLACDVDVSDSTVKRFCSGKRISPDTAYALIQRLGLSSESGMLLERNNLIELQQTFEYNTELPKQNLEEADSIFMTLTFTQDKKAEIEQVLRHLKLVLVDAEIDYLASGNGVSVYVKFVSDDQKCHVDMTILRLRKLATSCVVTLN